MDLAESLTLGDRRTTGLRSDLSLIRTPEAVVTCLERSALVRTEANFSMAIHAAPEVFEMGPQTLRSYAGHLL